LLAVFEQGSGGADIAGGAIQLIHIWVSDRLCFWMFNFQLDLLLRKFHAQYSCPATAPSLVQSAPLHIAQILIWGKIIGCSGICRTIWTAELVQIISLIANFGGAVDVEITR